MLNSDIQLLFKCLDTLDIGIFIVDKSSEYVYVNQAYADYAKYPKEFYDGMSIEKLKELGYISKSAWDSIIENKQATCSVITITDSVQERVYDVLTTATPIFDDAGEIEYVIYIQEAIAHLSDRLQRGVMRKGYFQGNQEIGERTKVNIIAESPQMQEILLKLETVAPSDVPVLISGPSGSGKEVLANFIHEHSNRNQSPLIAFNCSAIPENLLESELFGYEKGAFTGASSNGKIGLLEAANGGTLFIDEINSMPLPMQVKLLRALETKQVMRLGSTVPKNLDFRLVCTSNEDIHELVRQKRFRADLFYRINVLSVEIPPLKERKEDIIPLISHFTAFYCEKYSCVKALSPQLLAFMQGYSWPGNARELRNMIERMIVVSPNNEMEIKTIPSELYAEEPQEIPFSQSAEVSANNGGNFDELFNQDISFREYMDNKEKEFLNAALKHYHSPSAAAKALNIDLSNIYRKMQKHGIKKKF